MNICNWHEAEPHGINFDALKQSFRFMLIDGQLNLQYHWILANPLSKAWLKAAGS
jgi:hypothetical protein